MTQKFYADPRTRTVEPNGAISFAPGGPFDCLGHFAKVLNCPIEGTDLRRACYATGYADTFFSVPACTRVNGKHIGGFFTSSEAGPVFRPTAPYLHLLAPSSEPEEKAPNLDALSYTELRNFWWRHQGGKHHRAIFHKGGRTRRRAVRDLANYAINKATAMNLRLEGKINLALDYERICDSIFKSLPAFARW